MRLRLWSRRALGWLLLRNALAWAGMIAEMVGQILVYLVARDLYCMWILSVMAYRALVRRCFLVGGALDSEHRTTEREHRDGG